MVMVMAKKKNRPKNRRNQHKDQHKKTPTQKNINSASVPRLSLCMIARDEADFLDRCLQSIRGLVDEIVVVDTGSTDGTAGVVGRHGGRLLQRSWDGDFSAARNYAVQEARGEWVLVLDCDEELAASDHAAVRGVLEGQGASAYYLTTRNYVYQTDRAGFCPCGGEYQREEKDYPGWFPTTKVRLWRRNNQIRFVGAVHELVEKTLQDAGIEIGECQVPVHHYGYAEKERPADLYLAAGEEKVRQDPQDLLARYELSLAYRNAGRLEEALQCIEIVVAGLNGAKQVHLQEEFVWLVRGELLDRLGRRREAAQTYLWALDRFPASYQAHNNLGSVMERDGDVVGALGHYRQAEVLAPDNPVVQRNVLRLGGEAAGTNRLSVCIIARDEEQVLSRCLQSIAEVADQIVVVDTGSKDRTVEIAQKAGALIGYFDWCDDFAAARNASLDLADGDWILWLDADDYLAKAEADKVGQLKQQVPDKAFYFILANEGADRSRFRQVKMFPRRPGICFERPVHESVLAALEQQGIPVQDSGVEVRHSGYATREQIQHKKVFYLELMRRWIAQHPDDDYVRFRIGHTLYVDRDYDGARRELVELVDKGEAVQPRWVRRLGAVFYGRSLLEDGRQAEAEPVLRRALALGEAGALENLSLGDALVKLARYQDALPHLQRALQGQYDPVFPLDPAWVGYSALFFAARCHQALGQSADAVAALERAQRLQPERGEAGEMLVRLQEDERSGEPQTRPGKKIQLSLCMIVRDEEERLGRCLDSVKGLVDEIVVVDTGSRDRTVEIAQSHGAVMGHFPWCDDFSAARNVSLSLASGEWILWLDADDLMPAEYHADIRALLEQGRDKGYFFVLDDHGYENVSCLQMRLFPNLVGVEFVMPIHEQVTPSLAHLGVEMVPTSIRVVHTGYTTPEVVGAKKDRYLGIMERWLESHPGDYLVRSHVALTYHSTGRLQEAIEQYRLILEESSCRQDRNYVVYTTALLFTGRTYLKLERFAEALKYIDQALEVDPDYTLSKLSKAEVHGRLGQAEEVIRFAGEVIETEPQLTFFPVDQSQLRYSAHVLRGKAYQQQGQQGAAEDDFKSAAAIDSPRRAEALGSLALLYKEQGRVAEAGDTLETAAKLQPDNVMHRFNLGVLHLEGGRADLAEAAFRAVVDQEEGYDPAWLNLGIIAKGRGKSEDAEKIYRRLLAKDPGHVEAGANLGHMLLGAERFAEALEIFSRVRQQKMNLLDVNLGYLVAASATGTFDTDTAEAVCALFPEIERRPEDWTGVSTAAGVCGRLADVLEQKGMPQVAELALWCQVNLAPDDVGAQCRLGQVLMVRGDYWKAVGRFEAVLLRQPEDGAVFKLLGDCYQGMGAEEAARQCYERSRQAEGLKNIR
jgi:glycosyltransferase involved in cell wall biosynthesis/Tfp pilus assembly protein PilF